MKTNEENERKFFELLDIAGSGDLTPTFRAKSFIESLSYADDRLMSKFQFVKDKTKLHVFFGTRKLLVLKTRSSDSLYTSLKKLNASDYVINIVLGYSLFLNLD